LALVLVCGVLGVFWYFLSRPPATAPGTVDLDMESTGLVQRTPPRQPTSPITLVPDEAGTNPATSTADTRLLPPGDVAPELLFSTASVATNTVPMETALENLRTVFRSYASMFGGNPVGNNFEITHALLGENPKQAKFLNAESGLRINFKRELVDNWGTALFFHQLSGTEMEIHSAGPDKKMWTADDLVMK
jgi:hypothetical protein